MNKLLVSLADENAQLDFGASVARVVEPGMVVYLKGELGAGKTTLVRGLIHALGYEDSVTSPTYTLVESYRLPKVTIHHFDLYRLETPEELDFIGLRDYLTADAISLIEWPERGGPDLPEADLCCTIGVLDDGHGRRIDVVANSEQGQQVLEQLA